MTAARRTDALSRERIVEASIGILDADGEVALTFRALAARLATGAGALYHHVAGKDELLAATTDHVVAQVVTDVVVAEPREAIRALALGLFDAIDAHPWVGTQLAREPWRSANLEIFEGIGGRLQALGVPERVLFDAASALMSYVLGVAGQNAANARLRVREGNRADFLAAVAQRWTELDPADHPFVRQVAGQLREHDDRDQFLAGLDLVLAGIATVTP